MSTRKQRRANRRNSLKSTGPRTEAGRAAVRLNALKSGIDAQSMIIRDESAQAIQTLKDDYYERYQPAAPEEVAVLDSIIWADWLLRRYRKVEAQIWEQDFEAVDNKPRGHSQANPMANAFEEDSARFNRLHRRLDTVQRDYYRAMDRLESLQSERLTAEEEEIGFVPQSSEIAEFAPTVSVTAELAAPPTVIPIASSPAEIPEGTVTLD